NSDFTFKGSPLFTYGNKMLLFLSEVTDETVDNYWIVGSFSTIIDAVIIDGDWYFLDRLGMLTTETLGISKDPYSVDDMSKKVNAAYRESDEFAEANGYYTPYVYTRDEITSRINRFDGFVERIVKNEK
ncbi:MAG: hypothetical protein J5793_00020, partial [Clostridia bacterium]|nr:hypothetical protein [Clostridia bacterium]